MSTVKYPYKRSPRHVNTATKTAYRRLPAPKPIVSRIWKHHHMSQYRRLVILVTLINVTVLIYGTTRGNWWSHDTIALSRLVDVAVINITAAILVRQQYIINFLFWLFTRAPTNWPLALRWGLGKVFHFGGIHSGGNTAGTLWFSLFIISASHSYANGLSGISLPTLLTTYALVLLLFFIIFTALPERRARYHDLFERTHRFGGWVALLLFWQFTFLFTKDQLGDGSFIQALLGNANFWMLCLVTISVILPWLRLRRVPIKIERPSNHVALVHFNHGVTPFPGSSTTISRNPLLEWHAFANIPSPGESGFRLAISRAGDWTGKFIDEMPSHVWVKGITTAGVANIEVLFTKVVYVATGSGIGPCLPHLLERKVPAHLIWSTRDARATYGDALVEEILTVQPKAQIWDTNAKGRPDLVKLAYDACKKHGAEAVICISNQKLTRQVVYGLESYGIPAYGAIWDS